MGRRGKVGERGEGREKGGRERRGKRGEPDLTLREGKGLKP